MSGNVSKPNSIKGRPVITNIDPMFARINQSETTITLEGHGFWDSRDKVINGVNLGPRVSFYNKKSIDLLRLFAVPHPTINRTEQYNIFSQPLSSYNLYEKSGEPMTSKYPAFTGIELEPITTNQNTLTFKLPPALSSSFVDIIVANRAGYSRSSRDIFQSTDQHSINLTTENIASSGMIVVGDPTYYFKVGQSGENVEHFTNIKYNYSQTLLFDPFYDKTKITTNNIYTYQLSKKPDMSNVVQTITSTSFLDSVVFSPVESGTTYYANLSVTGGLKGRSSIVSQKTELVTVQAYEPEDKNFSKLLFKYSVSHDISQGGEWKYVLAKDKNFTDIVSIRDRDSFIDEQLYTDLESRQTYWSVVSSSTLNTISNSVSGYYMHVCDLFFVDLDNNSADNTYTLNISSLSNEKIYVTEIISDRAKGMVSPVANDQFGKLFVAVGEGFFRTDRGNSPGRLVFDGGFPKFYGYPHEHMPKDSMLAGRINYSFYQGNIWDHHAAGARWTESLRDSLHKGHSIYDGKIFPGQFAYLYNVFKYIQRQENQTNKILYINDFKNSWNSEMPAYGVARFYSTFYDIAEHAGMELEQLPGWLPGRYGAPKHDHVLEGRTQSLSSTDQWKNLFSNYDAIIWMGIQWNGEKGYNNENNNKNNYISQPVVDALEDFYDNGGGLFISTDHNFFQGCTTPVVSSYGIRFTGKANRTTFHPAYKVETILNNTSYIPNGQHPLFDGLNPGSYIYAGMSEGVIAYETGSGRLMNVSQYTTNSDGKIYIDKHNDGSPYLNNKIQVRTAAGCVSAFNI